MVRQMVPQQDVFADTGDLGDPGRLGAAAAHV